MTQTNDKTKLKPMNIAMLVTHGLNNVVSVFVSTFLISYIYSISTNYILNIGLFYCSNYFVMSIFYYLISTIIDKTDRVTFYRMAILVRGVFILCVVFLGKDLAKFVVLAGALHGFSEACYWTSYNLMKNELVSKHAVGRYSLDQFLVEKAVNIIIPLILGKIIDGESFRICAIIILFMVCAQLISSIFIKSKRPENSSFSFKEFSNATNKLEKDKKKLIVWQVIIAAIYGFAAVVAPLNTILIMISFDSNFSLGVLTSVFAILAMILVIVLKKKTKIGGRGLIYYISAIVPVIATGILIVNINKATVIAYTACYTLSIVLYVYGYDIVRNLIIKKFDMYDSIAEFQCAIELSMGISRAVIFGLMAIVGLISAGFDKNGLIVLMKVLCGASILLVSAMNVVVAVYERKFKKCVITED